MQKLLEADENALEKTLKFVNNDLEDELKTYFGENNGARKAPPRDSKVIHPTPGFCLKSFKANSNEKYFVNICQTDEILAPEDISDSQLAEILQSEKPSTFRIPMSISEQRIARDKSDQTVDVVDIAINSKFLEKIQRSKLFKEFFLALVGEALHEKFNIQLHPEKSIILHNRKFMGTLLSHRIRNTEGTNVFVDITKSNSKSMQELTSIDQKKEVKRNETTSNKLIQELKADEVNMLKKQTEATRKLHCNEPKYKLRARINFDKAVELQAEFFLPKCASATEFHLDVGEDRIVVESLKHGFYFDKFINFKLRPLEARAIFDQSFKMLQVRIPIVGE